ncbi:MAG: transcription antitermination factor NusB [Acidimicrobiales bacterium]
MEGRREARERALELLYEAYAKDQPVTEILVALPVRPDQYATDLVRGVHANRAALDERLARNVKEGWSLARMPVIDLTLLRLAAYELEFEPHVPLAVVIDEAVSLAKQFSSDDAGRFINGVLASIAAEVR